MSLFVPEAEFLNVRLSTAEVSLIVTALEEAARLISELGCEHEFVPQLEAMNRSLTRRLARLLKDVPEPLALVH